MTNREILRLFFRAFPADDPFPKVRVGHITVVSDPDRKSVMAWPQDKSWVINIKYFKILLFTGRTERVVDTFEHEGCDPTDDLVWLKMKL